MTSVRDATAAAAAATAAGAHRTERLLLFIVPTAAATVAERNIICTFIHVINIYENIWFVKTQR